MKILREESGQTLVLTILSVTILLGFSALAADIGIMQRTKRIAQTVADAAAVAGALEVNYGGNVNSAAQAAAIQNGMTNGVNGSSIAVNNPPNFGPHAHNASYVEVIASQIQPTIFMNLFNFKSLTISSRAVANSAGRTTGCIYTLGTTGTDISAVGNANISATNCGIIDDSNSGSALSLTGNVQLNAQSIGIVGGYSKIGNVTITPTPVTGITATSDPLAFLPTPGIPKSCTTIPAQVGSNTLNLSMGCYNGISGTGNTTVNLSPGTYVINGNINLNGSASLNGSGVTLVLEGSMKLPGKVSLNLSAPTSGTYNGVLIYQPASNTDALSFTGNAGSIFEGIVYAPGAAMSYTGNSATNIYADFVVKTLSLVGNASFKDYASINGNSVLSAVRLVE